MNNLKKLGAKASENADILMTIAAVLGLGSTVFLTVKATPKIMEALECYKKDLEDCASEEEIKNLRWYYAKVLVKLGLPVAVAVLLTLIFIIESTKVGRHKQAVLGAALNAANASIVELKDHMKSELGEKRYNEIETAFEEKRNAKYNEVMHPIEIRKTGFGDKLYSVDRIPGDPSTRMFFRSSPDAVKDAKNQTDALLNCDADSKCIYADYLYFLGFTEAAKWSTAMHTYHYAKYANDFISPVYREFIHPELKENWCHIDWCENEWQIFS